MFKAKEQNELEKKIKDSEKSMSELKTRLVTNPLSYKDRISRERTDYNDSRLEHGCDIGHDYVSFSSSRTTSIYDLNAHYHRKTKFTRIDDIIINTLEHLLPENFEFLQVRTNYSKTRSDFNYATIFKNPVKKKAYDTAVRSIEINKLMKQLEDRLSRYKVRSIKVTPEIKHTTHDRYCETTKKYYDYMIFGLQLRNIPYHKNKKKQQLEKQLKNLSKEVTERKRLLRNIRGS